MSDMLQDSSLLLISAISSSFAVLLSLWIGILYHRNKLQRDHQLLQQFTAFVDHRLQNEWQQNRQELAQQQRDARHELQQLFITLSKQFLNQNNELSNLQKQHLDHFTSQFWKVAQQQVQQNDQWHQEQQRHYSTFQARINQQLAQQHQQLIQRLSELQQQHHQNHETLREVMQQQLGQLRGENSQQLEQMRLTVDEKLHGTLETRLNASFQVVSERLEAVHQGLGEMQKLAHGVGDLKRVLSNVTTRGAWGEVQLANLLEQMLTPEQYIKNAQLGEIGTERVEFAIRLPGSAPNAEVLLPIDAKFPTEDFERLQIASQQGDQVAVEKAAHQLELRIKGCAEDISKKYINPPKTTDFALLFLPTEGLYAEVVKRPGLCNEIQRRFRIVIAGPSTLSALLNSLQMGFRTLAIQEHSSEVWLTLGKVKHEFQKFGPVLAGVKKKLLEASHQIDKAEVRTRSIDRCLQQVETLTYAQPQLEDAVHLTVEESQHPSA